MQIQVAKATLLVGSLLGALLLGELVLRLWRPHAVGQNRQPLIYERDATTGYRYRPNASGRFARSFEFDHTVTINAQGFHDEDRHLGEGERVIAAVGDSFTAAMHVPIREGWPRLLELYLREQADPSIRVVTLGLDGTGPDVQLELLRDHLGLLAPELVLAAFFENDAVDVRRERLFREVHQGYVLQYQSESQARAMRTLAERRRSDTLGWWLFERFYLYRLGLYLWSGDRNLFRTNVVSPAHVGASPRNRPAGANSLRQIFEEFRALGRTQAFEFVVVAVPGRDEPGRSLEILRRRAKLPGLRVVNPIPHMRAQLTEVGRGWEDLYWPRDGHFNAYGNRVFARAVANSLAGSLGVEPEDSRSSSGPAAPGASGKDSRSSKRNSRR